VALHHFDSSQTYGRNAALCKEATLILLCEAIVRFSIKDQLIAIAIVAVTSVISNVLFPHRYRTSLIVLQVIVGIVLYLLFSSVLYRLLHWYPLLFPRCPTCRDANRHYHTLEREWPMEAIKCAMCGEEIELCCDERKKRETPGHVPIRFILRWPYSFGGRWEREKN
jgi:hypothetical protein